MSPEKLEIIAGDITRLQVDAIVNAANSRLLGGSGVDGAIHRAAGHGLLVECRKIGGCPTGEARITGGYGLPARHVIHTVGPVYHGGDRGEADLLAACYRNCLNLAEENGIESMAFPSISAGVYGYPLQDGARIALRETKDFLSKEKANSLRRIIFCCYPPENAKTYLEAVTDFFPDWR